MHDFVRRTGLSRAMMTKLAEADAFDSLNRNRRSALWESLAQEKLHKSLPLFDQLAAEDEPQVPLPEMDAEEEVYADYQTTGLSLRAHPIQFHRESLDQLGVLPAKRLSRLANNRRVCVAGLVLLRQRPSTAKGITFVTLEDETGIANLVVKQPVWQRFYKIARRSPAWIVHGHVECKDSVIHVVVHRLEDLSEQLGALKTQSRDFR